VTQPQSPTPFSPTESAEYIHGMLVCLRKLALYQGHGLLAHLLQLAVIEAKTQADQETSLPG
jgi:hypothetical protein